MSKWTKQIALPVSIVILVSQWLAMLLVVQPQVVEADAWKFPWLELGVFLGVLGLFLTCFFRFSQKNPMVAIGDPLLKEALSAHH